MDGQLLVELSRYAEEEARVSRDEAARMNRDTRRPSGSKVAGRRRSRR